MSDSQTTTSARASGSEPVGGDRKTRGERKVRQGVVVSDKMDKTVVVQIDRRTVHPRYRKTITRTEKLHAHDETNDVRVGDRVQIAETRPLSKQKRWRVVEVIERAK